MCEIQTKLFKTVEPGSFLSRFVAHLICSWLLWFYFKGHCFSSQLEHICSPVKLIGEAVSFKKKSVALFGAPQSFRGALYIHG